MPESLGVVFDDFVCAGFGALFMDSLLLTHEVGLCGWLRSYHASLVLSVGMEILKCNEIISGDVKICL